jgi:hypothetical protein
LVVLGVLTVWEFYSTIHTEIGSQIAHGVQFLIQTLAISLSDGIVGVERCLLQCKAEPHTAVGLSLVFTEHEGGLFSCKGGASLSLALFWWLPLKKGGCQQAKSRHVPVPEHHAHP